MRLTIRSLIVAATIIAGLTAGGCGDDGDDPAPAPTSPGTAAATAAGTQPADATAAPTRPPGDNMTAAEYAAAFDALHNELRVDSTRAQATITARGETLNVVNGLTDAERALLHDILGVNLDFFDGVIEGVAGLAPPPEVQPAHDGYIAAREAQRDAYQEIDENVDTTDDPNNLLKLRDEPGEAVDVACGALRTAVQQAGVANGVSC